MVCLVGRLQQEEHLDHVLDVREVRLPVGRIVVLGLEQVDGEATWVVEGEVMGRAGAGGAVDAYPSGALSLGAEY